MSFGCVKRAGSIRPAGGPPEGAFAFRGGLGDPLRCSGGIVGESLIPVRSTHDKY